MNRYLVTGAAGLLGRHLVCALLNRGDAVRALVHRTPLQLEHRNLESFTGDVTEAERMTAACAEVDTVFHSAALIALLGGPSVSHEYHDAAWAINVGGTANLLAAARQQGVARFVYTSSVDVCLDGKTNIEMDHRTPYARRPRSVYAQTKIAAEKLVLAANGRDGLYTCIIRPDGIYAPEPNPILDSVVKQVARGAFKAAIGSAKTLQDNSYVGNVVHGTILAAEHLGPNGSASGKAYFISDYAPQNTFDFLRPIITGLGVPLPRYRIPRALIAPVLVIWEHLHFRFGIKPPPLAPHELDKVTISHYGSIEDAKRDLGYIPVKTYNEAIAECIPYCQELFLRYKARQQR